MKVLITYSSGFGTTREVAEEIGRILQDEGHFELELLAIDRVDEIDSYDALVIGSSVRADRPLANVRDFLALHRLDLKGKKIALFAVCLLANCAEGQQRVIDQYISQLIEKYPEFNVISKAAFGGKIDFDKLNPVTKSLMHRVLEKTGLPTEGSVDTRDWQMIREWSHELIGKIRENGASNQ